MNKNEFMTKASRMFHRTGLKIKKHSPEILLAGGVVGIVTSSVMACKATLKVNDVLDEAKQQVDTIHEVLENPEFAEDYSAEDGKKDLAIVYVQTGIKLVKLYGPSVLLGIASLGCVIGSNRILNKRNANLAAAYMAVDKGFKNYRSRVVERFGEELDRELRYNIKAVEVQETVTNEDGTETTVTTTVNVADPNCYSPYAIVYDDGNLGWEKDAELNKFFLVSVQNQANDKLKAQHHLFLNEVYDMLGARRTAAGAVVGWIYDEKHPIGDNYVDFGIFDKNNPEKVRFINGYERSIILDFNVDGPIQHLI